MWLQLEILKFYGVFNQPLNIKKTNQTQTHAIFFTIGMINIYFHTFIPG